MEHSWQQWEASSRLELATFIGMLCQELLTDEYVANFMMDKHSIRAMFHIFNPGYCNQFMKVGISHAVDI